MNKSIPNIEDRIIREKLAKILHIFQYDSLKDTKEAQDVAIREIEVELAEARQQGWDDRDYLIKKENGPGMIKNFIQDTLDTQTQMYVERLEVLMPEKHAKELSDNLETFTGNRACTICGTDPERQRELIIETIKQK